MQDCTSQVLSQDGCSQDQEKASVFEIVGACIAICTHVIKVRARVCLHYQKACSRLVAIMTEETNHGGMKELCDGMCSTRDVHPVVQVSCAASRDALFVHQQQTCMSRAVMPIIHNYPPSRSVYQGGDWLYTFCLPVKCGWSLVSHVQQSCWARPFVTITSDEAWWTDSSSHVWDLPRVLWLIISLP